MDTVVSLPTVPDYRSSGAPLVFTEAAARKVHELIAEEGNPGRPRTISRWNARA